MWSICVGEAAGRNTVYVMDLSLMAAIIHKCVSTVLAQDHFYSDFLSLSLTILTHKGSMRMILICCGMESALASVTGGMNISTTDFLNGFIFVRTNCREPFVRQTLPNRVPDIAKAAHLTRDAWANKGLALIANRNRNTEYVAASFSDMEGWTVLNVFEST